MSEEQSYTDKGWRIVRAISKLAYIYQSELEKDQSIEEVFSEIEELLDKNKKKWERSQSQILEVQTVEALTKIFKGIVAGRVIEKIQGEEIQLSEEQIQMKLWQLLHNGDDSDYHNYHKAIKYPLPTKEEIAEKGGPKEYALWYYHKARTSIIDYGKKIKSGELKFTPLRSIKMSLERPQYITSVCVNLLQLQPNELKWLAKGIKEMFPEE